MNMAETKALKAPSTDRNLSIKKRSMLTPDGTWESMRITHGLITVAPLRYETRGKNSIEHWKTDIAILKKDGTSNPKTPNQNESLK
jgi:hypothetical protein